MAKRDFYEVLGVKRDATEDQIKAAFRKLAKELHPDMNRDKPDAEHKFKEVSEAYDTLKDPQRRAAYDRFGHAAFEQGGGRGGGGFGFNPFGGDGPSAADFASTFSEVFEDLFGQRGGGGGGGGGSSGGFARARGSDQAARLNLTLEEAWAGANKTVQVTLLAHCDSCHGSGAAGGAAPQTCSTCKGAGRVRAQQGFFTIERTCPTCHGRGQTIANPCKSCSGQGRVRRERTIQVQVPRGVEDGNRIRLTGEGDAGGAQGAPGDLYIFVNIDKHQMFRRDGMDLYCKIPVSMVDAALGADIEAPTIQGGTARVTIPAGAQNAKQFRLRGAGMPMLRSERMGDMYIELEVETPVNLTGRQREILEEFRKIGASQRNSPGAEGFMGRLRDFWKKK